MLENVRTKIKELEKKNFLLEDKLRQWRLKFKKLVDYLRNKVCGLFDNKNQDIYKEIVKDLHDNDILTNEDYNKIHMKTIIKKVKIDKEQKKKDDDFEL